MSKVLDVAMEALFLIVLATVLIILSFIIFHTVVDIRQFI